MLTVGFIGAGGIASNYLGTLDHLRDVQVQAVCDIDETRAEAAARPRGAQAYVDSEEMLAEEELDAVFVCIPPFAHTDQAAQVARRGRAVFVAKPVGLTLETARATLADIEQAGVVNAVGYMWRYADITEHARTLLADRAVALAIGEVYVGTPEAAWWGQRDLSGGQIIEQATHVYDLVRYLCGEVTAVKGYGARVAVPDRVDFQDVAAVSMQLASGGVASVVNTCAAPDGRYALELIGRDLRLRLDYGRQLSGRIGAETIEEFGHQDGYVRQVEVFIDAVRRGDGSAIRSTYRDATRTLALTIAATEALASRGEVAVAEP